MFIKFKIRRIIVNVINMFRLGMGAYANRRKFVTGFENAPK